MFKHLSSMHKDRAENISKNKKNTVKTPIRKAKHIVLNGVKMSGKALQLYCLLLVAEQGASFKLLDSPAFQSIVRPYLDALPASEKVTINRRNIPGLIPEYANKVREIIADEVKGKLISLKLDGCTRKHRHFLGITAQFVDAGKLTVRTLAVEELFIKNSAPLIKTEVTRALDRFSIMVQNLFSITCDNAANYLLMARLFDKAAKELYAKLESLQYDEEDEDLRQWAEEDDDEDWPSIELIAEDSTSIQSSRCGAHTLQLAVDDAIKETPEVKALLTKVRDLAKFLRTPTMVRELKKQDLTLPKLDVVTRWGSSFDMCESVLGLKEFSQKSFSKADQQQYGLSANDWSKVEELIKCLRPARKASIKLQGKSILLGDFFRIWSTCYDKLTKLKHPLAEALCCAMEKRKQSEMYKNQAQGEKLSSLLGTQASKLLCSWTHAILHCSTLLMSKKPRRTWCKYGEGSVISGEKLREKLMRMVAKRALQRLSLKKYQQKMTVMKNPLLPKI
ncbi:uncharacterized protein LOC117649314 [Thrips palmi]|uniref:Uncharacterized protein LOC117649314 n=1 Tax=Thrips palmi TaxID=161013 RepID=A0A6P8ZRP7_THRPL|nr:uncharacterized protein LOC117649314 [Thrips palmi]